MLKRTTKQIETQKLIIKELLRRPQMPIPILAWVLWIEEKECELLVFDLEYKWSIEWRVSIDFLKEQENINIKIILDAIRKKLQDKVETLSLEQLESYLENSLLRKWKFDWDIEQDFYKPWNTNYIDKLLLYNENQIENWKEKIIQTIPKKI